MNKDHEKKPSHGNFKENTGALWGSDAAVGRTIFRAAKKLKRVIRKSF